MTKEVLGKQFDEYVVPVDPAELTHCESCQ